MTRLLACWDRRQGLVESLEVVKSGEAALGWGSLDASSTAEPLRAPARERPFHIVLVEPEIPPNTGNVARLCAATGCPLHLVGRLGFRIDAHAVRRAGLDYWHLVELHRHADFEQSEQAIRGVAGPDSRTWLFSAKARRSYLDARFELGDALVFGRESVGLPDELLQSRSAFVLGIPTLGPVRSHNLANSVGITLYEALRQTGCLELSKAPPP